ncbi:MULTISPECIES: hypothetical protein [Vibrio]|uniref:Uncharacterized protein n=3 Tax=Vibrio TaxID=662 RepID=A0A1R4LTZ0_VIBR1|nr:MULTISPECIES: hypothetical protein [Vibrio]KUI99937.1 hypothetical protein VRK_06500 [Vibrio sp. MEBiC08052]MDW6092047.1 hypothetical protein [Vibrio rhizosphaerae]WNJ96012.1 hypothetical protein RND59_02535 [Vibrio ruber]SIO96701.1 hypothetical protein VSP9026_04507 [Vibrio spartinae]SJN60056.1 hypothetical protein VR7878_03960 [Vibrio ruber DSM 16370]
MDDVSYTLPKGHNSDYLAPYHKPCPDMVTGAAMTEQQRKRNLFLIQKLREKHGLTPQK